MAYGWFEDNHPLRLLPLLSRDDPNGCIEFASHGTNRVFLSVGGHHGKSRIHTEWQQWCFRDLWFNILLTQLPLQRLLDVYSLCFLWEKNQPNRWHSSTVGSVASSQLQGLFSLMWCDNDMNSRGRKKLQKAPAFVSAALVTKPHRMLWVHTRNAVESYYQWMVESYYQFNAIS